MRTLSQTEGQLVSGGALTIDQATYAITLTAQAAVTLGLQLGLTSAGLIIPGVAPSMLISYVVFPAANIGTFAYVTSACNEYFRPTPTPKPA